MKDKPLTVFEILIPEKFSDENGSPIGNVPVNIINKIELELIEEFGGLTEQGRVFGAWRNENGFAINEALKKYTIAVDDRDVFFSKVEEIRDRTRQKSIFVVEVGKAYFV